MVTPRQLTQRAELYHQLSSLTAAGVGLIAGLAMVRDSPPARSLRLPLSRLIRELEQGATLTDGFSMLGTRWAASFDVALINAGENSGRLDVCFRFLAEYYQERARLARQVISDLLYPAFILHFAVLIFPVTQLTALVAQGDVLAFVKSKATVLLPVYAAVGALIYLGQSSHGEYWRAWVERLVRRIPLLGTAQANLALARLSIALESLLNAGVSIIEAWETAGAASGSPLLRRTVLAWRSSVIAGQTPAEAVRESRAFPELFTNLYSTGEVSGQLDSTLRRLYEHYQEEARRKLHAFAQWTPKLIYFGIVLLVAWQIVAFWAGYFSQISQLTF